MEPRSRHQVLLLLLTLLFLLHLLCGTPGSHPSTGAASFPSRGLAQTLTPHPQEWGGRGEGGGTEFSGGGHA